MAIRSWGTLSLAALGAGSVAGAGQLGIAYGLGIVRPGWAFGAETAYQWPAQLVWVGWIAMVSAVLGTVGATRIRRRAALPSSAGARVTAAAAASCGALVVAPLAMRPAAEATGRAPVSTVGTAALLGSLVGLALAVAVLRWRTVGWSVAASTGAGWFLALASALPSLGPDDPLPAVRLGVPGPGRPDAVPEVLTAGTTPLLALLLGVLLGAVARRRALGTPLVVTAGLAGPAMLATAYLVAGPGDAAGAYQAAPYWGALVGVVTGTLGSGLVALARWPLLPRERRGNAAAEDPPVTTTEVDRQPATTTGANPAPTAVSPTPPSEADHGPAGESEAMPRTQRIPERDATRGADAVADTTPGTRVASLRSILNPPGDTLPSAGSRDTAPPPARTAGPSVEETPGHDAVPRPDASPEPGQREPRRRARTEKPLPDRDAEYVDWVSGLGRPDPAGARPDRDAGGRRRLRRPDPDSG